MKRSAVWVAAISLMAGMMAVISVAPANATPTAYPVTLNFEGNDPSGVIPNDGGNFVFGGTQALVTADSVTVGNHVLELTRVGGGPAWQGATLFESSTVSLVSGSSSIVTIDIYSLIPNVPVLLKFEDGANHSFEKLETTTSTNQWETLTFNFTSVDSSKTWKKVSIFPNFNAANVSSEIFYVDSISLPDAVAIPTTVTPTINASTRLAAATNQLGSSPVSNVPGGVTQYYNANLGWKHVWEEAGSTFTLTFDVKDAGGAAAANGTQVTLKAATGYSNSNASLTESSTSFSFSAPLLNGTPDVASGVDDAGSFAGTVLNGQVSFTFTNTNTSSNAGDRPSNFNTAITTTNDKFSVFLLEHTSGGATVRSGNQGADTLDIDIIQVHFVKPVVNNAPTITSAIIRLSDTSTMTNKNAWWADGSANGSNSYVKLLERGSTLTLTYSVKNSSGTPLTSVPVTLSSVSRGGATYSAETLTGTTDSSGNVTFTLVNSNTNAQSEPYPTSPSSTTYWDDTREVSKEVATNLVPSVGFSGEVVDRVWTHIYASQSYTPAIPVANIRLSSADKATMTDKSYWWTNIPASHSMVKFVVAGSDLVLHYKVTDGNGSPLANKVVTLTKSQNNTGAFTGTLTGTTDTNGDVTFTLTNTNTDAQSEPYPVAPSSIIFWNDARNVTAVSVDFEPSVGAQLERIDRVWTHIVAAQGSGSNAPVAGPIKTIKDDPNYFESVVKPESKLDVAAGTFTCTNASAKITPTLAVYYLMVDNRAVAGLRFGKFVNALPLYPSINAIADGTATVTSATFKLDKSWNQNGHTARLQCLIQTGTSINTETLRTPMVQLKGVGKYKKFVPVKTWKPNKVTMRLVEPVMEKDASGKPVNFVDMSASPVQDHWSQYYGSSDGGLGVFYKYLTAGSTTTLKYKVTDSETKKAVPFFKVWLVVNKNYGGVENAAFTYENNGVVYTAAPHSGEFGETQFEGMTDANGFVTFTLVNTNTASEAEPKPAALNQEQPKSVTASCFSTITLMAHLGSDETMETKDFIWAHIVKP